MFIAAVLFYCIIYCILLHFSAHLQENSATAVRGLSGMASLFAIRGGFHICCP